MVLAWLFLSGLLLLHGTIFDTTAIARAMLVVVALAWLFIPVQMIGYYRKKR
jgi:hypothetical protein